MATATANAEAHRRMLVASGLQLQTTNSIHSQMFDDNASRTTIGFDDNGTLKSTSTIMVNKNEGPDQSETFPLISSYKTPVGQLLKPKMNSLLNILNKTNSILSQPQLNTRAQSNITIFDASPRHFDSSQNNELSSYDKEPYNHNYRRHNISNSNLQAPISVSAAGVVNLDNAFRTASKKNTSMIEEIDRQYNSRKTISIFK